MHWTPLLLAVRLQDLTGSLQWNFQNTESYYVITLKIYQCPVVRTWLIPESTLRSTLHSFDVKSRGCRKVKRASTAAIMIYIYISVATVGSLAVYHCCCCSVPLLYSADDFEIQSKRGWELCLVVLKMVRPPNTRTPTHRCTVRSCHTNEYQVSWSAAATAIPWMTQRQTFTMEYRRTEAADIIAKMEQKSKSWIATLPLLLILWSWFLLL